MANFVAKDVRESMEHFWEVNSKNADVKEMFLDSKAEEIGECELPEILSLLPSWKNQDVLELGAGIGRFTGILGQDAHSVIAVDFVEKFTKKNEQMNGSMKNIKFQQADVTKLDLPPKSVDIIFSNWLFMYLSDAEIQNVTKKMLTWLRKDGFFFFRESCYQQSGNAYLAENPTKYRSVGDYNRLFLSTAVPNAKGIGRFDVCQVKSVQSYVKMKNNKNQICWLLKKVDNQQGQNLSLREYLDTHQYTVENIRGSEKLFGENFVSPGGETYAKDFAEKLQLGPRMTVLNIGSAVGGFAFLVAKEYGAKVTGVDLSLNMVTMAMEKNKENRNMVTFEMKDTKDLQYRPSSFDIIYSNGSLHYVKDKKTILKRVLTWLKPGGKILFSGYCSADADIHEDLELDGQHLLSIEEYEQLLTEIGFVQVEIHNRTPYFLELTNKKLQEAAKVMHGMNEECPEADFKPIIERWNGIVKRTKSGYQKWVVFYAKKP